MNLGLVASGAQHRPAMSILGRLASAFRRTSAEPLALPAPAEPPTPSEPPLSRAEEQAILRSLASGEFFDRYPAAATPIAKAGDVPQMPATPVTEPVGVSGLAIFAGQVTDNESSADLRGTQRYKHFETWKRTVAPVGQAMREHLMLSGAPSWSVKPYKADDADEPLPEDVERAAWLKRQIDNLATEWGRVVMEHAMALIDGARVGVWTAKAMPPGDLGVFGLADVLTVPLSTIERWDVDVATGRLRGIVQRDPDSQAEIPIARERLIYSRDLPTTTHPAGDGVMRFLAETIRRLQKLEDMLDKAFEKDVNGIPIIYAPIFEKMAQIGKVTDSGETYTRAMFDRDMRDAVTFASAAKRKDAGLVLDSSTVPNADGTPSTVRRYHAEVLTAQASSHEALRGRIKDLGWDILAMLSSEQKAMGRDSGTQALHRSKEAGRLRVVSSFLNGFATTARRDLVRPLWILNGFDPASPSDPQNLPTLEWNALEFADGGAVVQSVSAILTAAGVEPGRADAIVAAILTNLGLPPLAELDPEAAALGRERALSRAGVGPAPTPDPEDDPLDPPDPADPEED